MERSAKSKGSAFVVRIWLEWSESGACWRGQIEHLQSKQKHAFLHLEQMLAFMQNYVAMPLEKENPVKDTDSGQRVI